MKKIAYIAVILTVALNLSCATTQETSRKSVFSFSYDEHSYEIVSLNTKTGEGTNVLYELVDNTSDILARDINQDGTIDIVIKGSLTLEECDEIYKAGINTAKQSGNYQERTPARQYQWVLEEYTLVISTYTTNIDHINNVFLVRFNNDQAEHMYTDIFGDGVLNSTDKGYIQIERAQQLYEMTLLKGLDEKRMLFEDGTYKVKQQRTSTYRYSSTILR